MEAIDLTKPEDQGKVNYHIVDKLNNPGVYVLPFADHTDDNDPNKITELTVTVVHVFKDTKLLECGHHLILVESNGQYQDFYYSAQKKWKFNTEKGLKAYEDQFVYEVEDFCPRDEFYNEVAKDLEQFKNKLRESIPDEYRDVVIGIDDNLGLIPVKYEN